jgi:hypothetical protein
LGVLLAHRALAQPPDILVGDLSTRAIFVLLDGEKRLAPDMATLRAMGFAPEQVRWEAGTRLAQIPSGPNLLPLSFADLIRDQESGALYLLTGGKRAIPSEEFMAACGWSEAAARTLPTALVAAIPELAPLPDLRPGMLIRQQGESCFYLLAGGKHWLPEEKTLAAGGWDAEAAVEIEPLLIKLIREREVIPSLYPGCLIQQEGDDERVYILDQGKHLIPNEETFVAYGWNRSRIWRLPAYILEAIPEGAALQEVKKGRNLFALGNWGQCTWYVAERRIAPSTSDAKDWLADAQANGFATGDYPMPGAVAVWGLARGEYGHVAYVETAYANGVFAYADSNVCGWECVRTRITNLNKEPGILGFVYWKYDQ